MRADFGLDFLRAVAFFLALGFGFLAALETFFRLAEGFLRLDLVLVVFFALRAAAMAGASVNFSDVLIKLLHDANRIVPAIFTITNPMTAN